MILRKKTGKGFHFLLCAYSPNMPRGSKRLRAQKVKSKEEESEPNRPKKKRGNEGIEAISLISCGSFNPITNMHLRMFEAGRDHLQKVQCAKVERGIISPVSDGYGKQGLESSSHRVKMCLLAIKSNPWLEVSRWESKKDSWTPTIEVLRNLKEILKAKNDNSKLMLLCGSDLLESFNKPGLWKECDIREILCDFGVVVLQRPGFNSEAVMHSNKILSGLKDQIHIVKDVVNNDTSSTLVRSAIRSGKSVKYLTPDSVVNYIAKHNLYASEESENRNSDRSLAPYQANAESE